MRLALAGNQNCGKTTLFNALTGSSQHVGNFPGVTVEKKEGRVRFAPSLTAVDLPGVYSLNAYTAEEEVARTYLLRERPEAVLNVADATCPARGLYLTLQLIELGLPVLLALNMMDEVRANGGSIDLRGLAGTLGVPVVPICASKGEGVEQAAHAAALAGRGADSREKNAEAVLCGLYAAEGGEAVLRAVEAVRPAAVRANLPPVYAAMCALQGGAAAPELELSGAEQRALEQAAAQLERASGLDREAAVVALRYRVIDRLCGAYIRPGRGSKSGRRTARADALLTGRVLALPFFAAVMLGVFWVTFGPVGSGLSAAAANLVGRLTAFVSAWLTRWQVAPWLRSLVVDGLLSGIGSVLGFLPTVLLLFLLLSLLEDSGYMARVAFVMDKPLRKIGLSGRSIVPALIGFGCSVPAVLATRTLPTDRDRRLTALLVPYMSCSAKLPIYAMFTELFFEKHKALVMAALYLLGIGVGLLYALFFKHAAFAGREAPFVLELPNYRLPSPRSVWQTIRRRAGEFLRKAFTVILLASVAVWFLQSFSPALEYVSDSAVSLLAAAGRWAAPVFAPLGFGDWRAVTALLTGLSAKETVVSTLSVLLGRETARAARALFSPASAFAFLVFILLYPPCVAAFAALRRELGSVRSALLAAAAQLGIAWLAAFAAYRLWMLFA